MIASKHARPEWHGRARRASRPPLAPLPSAHRLVGVDRVGKAKRLAALPATEAARLRRAIATIREEAEKAQDSAKRAEVILEAAFRAACGNDWIVAVALARHALIECVTSHRFGLLRRYCEMAEEGTLCA